MCIIIISSLLCTLWFCLLLLSLIIRLFVWSIFLTYNSTSQCYADLLQKINNLLAYSISFLTCCQIIEISVKKCTMSKCCVCPFLPRPTVFQCHFILLKRLVASFTSTVSGIIHVYRKKYSILQKENKRSGLQSDTQEMSVILHERQMIFLNNKTYVLPNLFFFLFEH